MKVCILPVHTTDMPLRHKPEIRRHPPVWRHVEADAQLPQHRRPEGFRAAEGQALQQVPIRRRGACAQLLPSGIPLPAGHEARCIGGCHAFGRRHPRGRRAQGACIPAGVRRLEQQLVQRKGVVGAQHALADEAPQLQGRRQGTG